MLFFIPYGTKEKEPRRKFPVVNVTIVVACIAVFLYQVSLALQGPDEIDGFMNSFAAVPKDIIGGVGLEIGLITAMFLHAGLLHIAGNMLYLLPFGDNLEDRLGHFRYLLFYLLCGIAATVGFSLLNPDSSVPLIGASGAIAGVLGGYIALHPTAFVKGFMVIVVFFTRIDLPALVFIGYWFILQLFSTVASVNASGEQAGGVAYSAHVIGFVAGLLLMPLFKLLSPSNPS